MMSQDNRLLPMPSETLDRPLRDFAQPSPVAVQVAEPAHLREYLAVVLKRKWLIFSLAIVVTSLVAIHMYRLPSIYEAETTIQIEERNKSVLQTKELVIAAPSNPTYWPTQLKLLENPELARQVILALDLQNNPAFLGGQARTSFISSVRRVFSRARPAPMKEAGVQVLSDGGFGDEEKLTAEQLEQLEPYEDALRANLNVVPVEKTNLVDIRFTHTDPEIATKVADALAAVFIYRDTMRETQGSTKASETLAREIAELQIKIRQNQEERLNYLRNNNLPLGEIKGQNLTADRLGTLSGLLLGAEHELGNVKASYDAAQRADDVWSIPEVQESKVVQRLREKIEGLEERRAALLSQYTEEWPEVKKIDQQLIKLKQDLDRAPREILSSSKARLDAAYKKKEKVQQDYNRELGSANQQSKDLIWLANITQQLETNKQFYNTLYQRQKELQITSSDRSNNVTVATPARLPREPIGPRRGRNIVIALFLSLGAGIGLAFLLDYLDDTLKSVEDVDRHLQLPTLAMIPAPRGERLMLLGRGAAAANALGAGRDSGEGGGTTTALALIEDVRSPITEAYRHLRTSLLLSVAGQPPKTVLVTSSQPSEGKTTTAVNLAMVLAQTGAQVLIMDCDLRRPRIHTHFGLANSRGVTNYLSGEADLDGIIQSYDKMPNLMVLPSGPVPPNSAELIGSDEMRKLLHALGERFKHIVIDSPPAISFTDASILSTLVDGVMLVVHGGRSSRSVVRRAKQQLLDVGANIFGIVLNNVKLESQNYYYYSNYYASYYANEDDDGGGEDTTAAGAKPAG